MKQNLRNFVFTVVESELDYQESLDASRTDGREHTVGEYVTMLQYYQNELVEAWTMNPGDNAALESMRKIAGIAFACMEKHGANHRK